MRLRQTTDSPVWSIKTQGSDVNKKFKRHLLTLYHDGLFFFFSPGDLLLACLSVSFGDFNAFESLNFGLFGDFKMFEFDFRKDFESFLVVSPTDAGSDATEPVIRFCSKDGLPAVQLVATKSVSEFFLTTKLQVKHEGNFKILISRI